MNNSTGRPGVVIRIDEAMWRARDAIGFSTWLQVLQDQFGPALSALVSNPAFRKLIDEHSPISGEKAAGIDFRITAVPYFPPVDE